MKIQARNECRWDLVALALGEVKALKAPLPQIPLVPTGGVTLSTAGAFIKAGASAFGVGNDLISESELLSGNRIHIWNFSWISISIRIRDVVAGFSPRSVRAYGHNVPKANAG